MDEMIYVEVLEEDWEVPFEDEWEEEEWEFNEDKDEYTGDYEDFDLEMGFDPYEGCWTGDC